MLLFSYKQTNIVSDGQILSHNMIFIHRAYLANFFTRNNRNWQTIKQAVVCIVERFSKRTANSVTIATIEDLKIPQN